MKRITITLLLTLALALPTGAQDKPKKVFTARQAAMEMLRLANKISDSDLKGKDEIAELAEMLSAKLLEKNGTWLCSTDTECAKLEAKLK